MSSEMSPVDRSLVPPREMLFDGSSSEEQFILLGENFCRYILIQRAYLQPQSSFLDVGCGNGSVAVYLTRYLTTQGRYEGLDVHPDGIAWLQQRYAAYPNFRFTLADVYNKMYNPDGGRAAADYSFPYASATFDMVMLKSVFTHMMPADLSRYMSEVGRVLKPGGRSVISYFLLNDESRRYIARGADKMGLVHELEGDRLCRIANLEVPEAVVAHDEARIRGMYADAGMSLSEVVYGDWCGRQSLLGLQDFIVGIKETPAASDRDAIRDSEAAADAASR